MEDVSIEQMSSLVEMEENTTESVSTPSQINPDNYSLPLDRSNFTKLTNALTLIQGICSDCEISEGNIRCRTDDRKNLISMDLTSILDQRNIAFSGLKNKLILLNTFSFTSDTNENDNTILIEANQSNFEFSDSTSRLIVRRPISSYLNNTYVNDEDFSTIANSVREDAVLFRLTINNMEKKRLSKLCDAFCSNSIIFEFNGDTCNYYVETTSKDNVSKSVQNINLNRSIEGKKTLVNNLAVVLDIPDNLEITCYLVGENYCMFKSELKYFGIPVTILTKSRIVDINND